MKHSASAFRRKKPDSSSGNEGKKCEAKKGNPCFFNPYHVRLAVTDVAPIPVYDLNLAVDPSQHSGFIFQPDERYSDQVAVLKPGETAYSHTYVLVPKFPGSAEFEPSQTTIKFAGVAGAAGASGTLPESPQYSLEVPDDTPGYIHLHWDPVPEATGYEVFETAGIEAPFGPDQVEAAESPGGPGVLMLPSTATDAFLPTSAGPVLAVSAIVKGQPTLESAVVEVSSTPETPPSEGPFLAVKPTSVVEPSTSPVKVPVMVSLSAAAANTVSVGYETVDGTGTEAATAAHHDYTPTRGTVTFAPGEVNKTITVEVNPSGLQSSARFEVELKEPVDAQIKEGTAIVSIYPACVVPNPNGSVLTNVPPPPAPIPGAVTVGNLEAVGCFQSQSDGSYTTTKPVRLNGIDLLPEAGTTVTVHASASVTTNGPAQVGVGKLFMIPLPHVTLHFGSGSVPPLDPDASLHGKLVKLFGIPIVAEGVGDRLKPWASAGGQTTVGLSLALPTTLNATSWDAAAGNFKDGRDTIATVGGTASVVTTNRDGFSGQKLCAVFAGGEFKLWNLNVNTSWISNASACYGQTLEGTNTTNEWTLAGMFKLPPASKRALPFDAVGGSIGFRSAGDGVRWTQGSIQVDGINLSLADGVFLQRLGANFSRDFTNVPPTQSNFGVSAGLSLGPRARRQGAHELERPGAAWAVGDTGVLEAQRQLAGVERNTPSVPAGEWLCEHVWQRHRGTRRRARPAATVHRRAARRSSRWGVGK